MSAIAPTTARWTLAIGEHGKVELRGGGPKLVGDQGAELTVAPVSAIPEEADRIRDGLLSDEMRDVVMSTVDVDAGEAVTLLRVITAQLELQPDPGVLTKLVDPMSAVLALAEDPNSIVSARFVYADAEGPDDFKDYSGEAFLKEYAAASSSFEKVRLEVNRAWIAGGAEG